MKYLIFIFLFVLPAHACKISIKLVDESAKTEFMEMNKLKPEQVLRQKNLQQVISPKNKGEPCPHTMVFIHNFQTEVDKKKCEWWTKQKMVRGSKQPNSELTILSSECGISY